MDQVSYFDTPTEAMLRKQVAELKRENKYLKWKVENGNAINSVTEPLDDVSISMPAPPQICLHRAATITAEPVSQGRYGLEICGVSKGRSTDRLEVAYYLEQLPRSANDVAHMLAKAHERFIIELSRRCQ